MTMNETFQEALEKLDSARGELVLDLSSVRRIDSSELRALENLAKVAEEKSVKVALSGVNVGVYRVLKLSRTGLLACPSR
jgi:anti-anti-sigma factor